MRHPNTSSKMSFLKEEKPYLTASGIYAITIHAARIPCCVGSGSNPYSEMVKEASLPGAPPPAWHYSGQKSAVAKSVSGIPGTQEMLKSNPESDPCWRMHLCSPSEYPICSAQGIWELKQVFNCALLAHL